MRSSWIKVGLGALSLLSNIVNATPGTRIGASPSYQGRDNCPGRCSIAGPNPGNWSLYHSLDQTNSCQLTKFYDFSIYDLVDDSDTNHRIFACSSFGSDWSNLPNATGDTVAASTVNSTYQFGSSVDGSLAGSSVRSLSRQIRDYISNGYGSTNKSVILYAQSGPASAGIYIGKGLQNEDTTAFALQSFEKNVRSLPNNAGTVAMQLCQPGNDGDHVFGFIATSNSSFSTVQAALQLWSNATCLSFSNTTNITGPAFFTTPSFLNMPTNGTVNSTISNPNSTLATANKRSFKSFTGRLGRLEHNERLQRRSDCTYTQVASGDGCSSLAQKCGISQTQFRNYNPSGAACGPTSFQPGEYVCCSPGTLPDLSPQPNADGSCATYTVQSGDNCAAIAASNDITTDQLNEFNANTWGWTGCTPLGLGTICLSTGTPPMPAPVANALCGPTVPGTPTPPAGTNVSTLNPCPLNACCDIWGQVSITNISHEEFSPDH
jgi:hypothetical protein